MREALARVQMEVGVGEREREEWAKLTSRRKLYCGHVTGLVVMTVRQASSNSHLVHYFKTNLT